MNNKIRVLYVVPRCNTWSDRYYELLTSNIPNSHLCFLPNYINFIPFILLFWRLFSSEYKKADIIHTNCEFWLFLFSFHKKIVLTFHHNSLDLKYRYLLPFYKNFIYNYIVRYLYYLSIYFSSLTVFVNKKDLETFKSIFSNWQKLLHIGNGIDFSELSDVKNNFFTDQTLKPRILFIGKKTFRKWWDLLEKMFLLSDFSKIQLSCTSMSWSKVNSIFFEDLWCLPRKSLLSCIKSSDLVFLPSRIEWFSYTIAESLALWTPVLAREDWSNFQHTFPENFHLFHEDDSENLILKQILFLASGKKGVYNFFNQDLDIFKVAWKYMEIYQTLKNAHVF